MGIHWKIFFFLWGWGGGGGWRKTKNQYIGGLAKKGGLGKFADLKAVLGKKEEAGVFGGCRVSHSGGGGMGEHPLM